MSELNDDYAEFATDSPPPDYKARLALHMRKGSATADFLKTSHTLEEFERLYALVNSVSSVTDLSAKQNTLRLIAAQAVVQHIKSFIDNYPRSELELWLGRLGVSSSNKAGYGYQDTACGWFQYFASAGVSGENLLALAQVLEVPAAHQVAVSILFVGGELGGSWGKLHVQSRQWPNGYAPPHSTLMLHATRYRDYSQDWNDGFAEVWREYEEQFRKKELDVEWWVEVYNDQNASIQGQSAQAAFAAALHILHDGGVADSATAISATYKNAHLGHVEGLFSEHGNAGQKLRAATRAGISRVVVSPADYASLTPETKNTLAELGIAVLSAAALEEALPHVTGVATALVTFAECMQAALLADARQRMLGIEVTDWASLESRLVEVKMARGLRPKLSDEEYRLLEMQREQGDHRQLNELETERADFRQEEAQAKAEKPRETITGRQFREMIAKPGCWVVLGDPGFGKTALLRLEAGRRCIAVQEQVRQGVECHKLPLAIFVRAAELAKHVAQNTTIAKSERLVSAALNFVKSEGWLTNDPNQQAETIIRNKLANGTCLLVVDALDEVPESALKTLHEALSGAEKCAVLASSRLVGYIPLQHIKNDDNHLEMLAFNDQQMKKSIEQAVPHEQAISMLAKLQTNVLIREVLRSPLLLHLACGVAKNKQSKPWETRAELYELFVSDCITQAANSRRVEPLSIDARESLLQLVCELSLKMVAIDVRRTIWKRNDLFDLACEVREQHLTRSHIYGLSRPLIDDLCKIGLFVPMGVDDDAPLMWLHRSFGEYFAAKALAKRLDVDVNHPDWSRVDRWAHSPDYEPTVRFLASCLDKHRAKLLSLLADETKDDWAWHRRGLAVFCLGELPKVISQDVLKIADPLADSVFPELRKWRRNARYHRPRLWHAWPTLASFAPTGQKPFVDQLMEEVRTRAFKDDTWDLVQHAGASLVPEQISPIVGCLVDEDIRGFAMRALWSLGDRLSESHVRQIVDFLVHPNEDIRRFALEVLGNLGRANAS